MYLETNRLIIRSIELEDEKAFTEMAADGSLAEDIFGGYQGEYSNQIHAWVIEAILLDREDDPKKDYISYTIIEKMRNIVIGSVGCSYYEDSKQVGIVYFIGAKYRGNAYAAEAATAYIKYFFEHYNISKIVATIRVANGASCKTAEKIGFVLVETKKYKDYMDVREKLYNFYEINKECFDEVTREQLEE